MADLYFYKGRYRTDNGLKRALIKDGIIWVSPKRNYYCWDKQFEYCYDFEYMRDYCHDYELITDDEYKHFRKWLNKMIKAGEITICNTSWYHCDENDGIGTPDFWDAREAVVDSMDRFDPKYPDDFIETLENSVEEYYETLTDEEFKEFEKLPDEVQEKAAMKWRIKMYNNYKRALI